MQTTFRFQGWRWGLVLVFAVFFMASFATAQQPSSATLTVSPDGTAASVAVVGPGDAGFAASRVIVRFRAGVGFLPGSGASRLLSAANNIHLVNNPPGRSVAETIARYRANPNVIYAEPDYTVNAILTPNDPEYLDVANKQWDLAKISAAQAWNVHTNSNDVVVAIVDTGIDFNHPDLQANLYSDGGAPPVHGYTCMSGTCVAGGFDDHGHGTHVAGTIGAATNNGIGIAGINWSVKLLAIKFLGSGGSGSISDAVLAFDLLKNLKIAGVNIRVTNNSWGGGGFSQALKDSMAALEDTPGHPSTLNVCAAGNSGVNADFNPMFPAAYTNRGIVSVLASDATDAGAGFTNFGLTSVDIAAPGVNTYSTASTGACALCDPTGYRYLSGTSMASPHVAGVAAALFSMNPSLTAALARDALLDPGSYDWMVNAKAQSTSSGGRLNYYKTLTNPFLSSPTLNGFPTVTVGPDVFTTANGSVNFTASASDPNGDTLRTSQGRGPISAGSAWLFGWEVNQLFPSTVPFTAPWLARTAAMPYDTSVADNRGGGASGRNWAVVFPVVSPGGAPSGTLNVPATGSVGVPVNISFIASDPDGQPISWDLWASANGGSSGWCCFTGNGVSITFSAAGAYRIEVQAIDFELNTSPTYTAVISIGGVTGQPPIAAATLDKLSGPVPLTVNINMGGSSDPDGTISYYYIGCGGGFTAGTTGATGSCNFTDPGTYWLLLQVRDNLGNMGLISRYVVATPPEGPPSDTTPPTVAITKPQNGANVSGVVTLEADASDNTGGSGMKEVEYYLDSVSVATSLGVASAAPYTKFWNSASAALGAHTIYAVARDNATNTSLPASVGVTVPVVTPTVSLSPSGPVNVAKKATLTMTATITNSPSYPIGHVDFLVGSSVICSVNSAPYSCGWKAPAATKAYQAQVKAYDSHNNVGSSNVLSISVK